MWITASEVDLLIASIDRTKTGYIEYNKCVETIDFRQTSGITNFYVTQHNFFNAALKVWKTGFVDK